MVQLLTLYTDPERHNAQRCRRSDRRTEYRRHYDANSTVIQYDRLTNQLSKCIQLRRLINNITFYVQGELSTSTDKRTAAVATTSLSDASANAALVC